MKYLTYVGSYTGEGHTDGIHILESDAETGGFRVVNVVGGMESPTYMALNRDCTRLYTVLGRERFGGPRRNGGLAAWAVDGERLDLLNEMPTGWSIPCHVSLDPAERTLVYAEYSCGTAGFAELREDGSLDLAYAGESERINARCQVAHVGSGPNLPRQDRAHAHCAVVTPDGRYLMVADLSLDRVFAYDFANRAGGLREVPTASIDTRRLAPGAGPRQLVFHPNGKLALVVFELHNLVSSFRYTGEGFVHLDTQPLLDPALRGASKAAAIKLSEDGTQVFCSNRGHDSVTAFNLDVDSGRLEFLSNTKLGGLFPRDFAFMPGGRFMLAGLKESWRVASFAYDRERGSFEEVAREDGIYRPLFFKFKLR